MSGNRFGTAPIAARRLTLAYSDEALRRDAPASEQPVPDDFPYGQTFVLKRPGGSSDPSPTRKLWMGMAGIASGLIIIITLLIGFFVKAEWSLPAFWQRQANSGTDELVSSPPRSFEEPFVQHRIEEKIPPLMTHTSTSAAAAPAVDAAAPEAEGQRRLTPPPQSVQVQRPFDRQTIAVMVKRGMDLLASGDVAGARPVLQRAAEAGDADAALALATTYDPVVLRKLKVYGLEPDAAKARNWYEQAKKLGSAEAPN